MNYHNYFLLLAITILIVLYLCIADSAFGHTWYPSECCSDKDCKPIDDPREVTDSGDYYIYKNMRFPKRDTRQSPDERYHVCIPPIIYGRQTIRCFFRPIPGA